MLSLLHQFQQLVCKILDFNVLSITQGHLSMNNTFKISSTPVRHINQN